jgi:hypothetical protein
MGSSASDASSAFFPSPASHVSRREVADVARNGIRRPGGQPGNRCRWVHGRRSAAAVQRRKQGAATRKTALWLLALLDALNGYRARPSPLRPEQTALLDAQGRALARALGVPGA